MKGLLVAAGLLLAASTAVAEDAPTVSSLLAKDYEVVSSTLTQSGLVLLLENDTSVYMCLVAETPDGPEVTTKYCKPVK
jgi:hypothetical protein